MYNKKYWIGEIFVQQLYVTSNFLHMFLHIKLLHHCMTFGRIQIMKYKAPLFKVTLTSLS